MARASQGPTGWLFAREQERWQNLQVSSSLQEIGIQQGPHEQRGREVAMRWLRQSRLLGIVLIVLAVVVYLIMMWGVFPLLWPYRDHPLVRVLLALLSGGHLEELFQETGSLL
jgi:hypothetical protein